jgi:Acetyltransferase (GNAT) domain
MQLCPYSVRDAIRWDEFVAGAPMATFLHTRRFLAYHGNRFKDVSVLIAEDKGTLVGVFPAAVDKDCEQMVVSHPGITYGGLLHSGKLRGEKMLAAVTALKDYYRQLGFETLRYKPVPYIYHQVPSGDDLYALFCAGAVRYRCDLSCAIDLDCRPPVSERRKRGLKRALKHGVEIVGGADFIQPLWRVLEDNLVRKFDLRPVHSCDEIEKLHALFSGNIEFVVARLNSEVIAGVALFVSARVVHAQYTATSEKGQELSALDAVFDHCIEKARVAGARYFDFGVSTENDGQYLNDGLYRYKSEFGAGGVVHEFYEINLNNEVSQA